LNKKERVAKIKRILLPRSEYYVLEGHTPVPVDMMTWANSFESRHRHVARIKQGDIEVSTVFLGLNHSFGGEEPMLFETMIFGMAGDKEYQTRCSTWEEAEKMHAKACRIAGIEWIKPHK
jgi:hypothetical protein